MSVNIWGQVGVVTGFLPMSALTGLTGQLLGMNAAATLAEWKTATYLNSQFGVPTGSQAVPPYSFTGNLNMGFYADTILNALSITISGTRRFRVSDTVAAFEVAMRMEGKVFSEEKSANIIAAANIDLSAATGNYVYITNLAGAIIITRLGGVLIPSGTSFELKFKITAGSITLKNDPNYLAVLGGTDLPLFDGDVIRVRKTNDADQFWEMVSYSKFQSLQITAVAQLPVTIIHPDINDRPAMAAGGWLPWNLNQQWGGAGCMPYHMVDSATGTEYKFDAFDGYINDNNIVATGNAAGAYYSAQVITPAKNMSLQAMWLKLYKTGNPVDNATLQLWSVAAGVPGALIATANVINGKQITSDVNGQFYRFAFAVAQALVAGTQYFIVLSKSAGVDAANYYNWKLGTATKYPNNLFSAGTIVPAWTPANTNTAVFICEAQASDQPIQATGTFNGRIVGSEGNPINRSVAWNKPLRSFFPLFDPMGWSILIRGKTWVKDRTIVDFIYGIHHDRINIRSAIATGFVTATLYDRTGTITTVVGNSDVSGATYKDVLVCGRSLGDGADYLRIYTGNNNNWTKESESVAQTFNLDQLMLDQGTAWIMGGFQLFSSATYTKLSDMTILPSADGWTFTTTTATAEGNVFAVAGGKLNQIKAGMAAGGDGFYRKAALALSNVNGWAASFKLRVVSQTNTKDENAAIAVISDGAKAIATRFQEYWTGLSSTTNYYPQQDLKLMDSTIWISGKGSDCLSFINGKLIDDHTAQMLAATANNQVDFGDTSTTANENADVVWDYAGYYNTANVYPQFTSGELHEFAVFVGEQGTLGQALYNGGAPISVKQYCGIDKNYVGVSVIQNIHMQGISSSPTVTATAFPPTTLLPEQEVFVVGSIVGSSRHKDFATQSTDQSTIYKVLAIDGACDDKDAAGSSGSGAGGSMAVPADRIKTTYFGLHKLEYRWGVNANTGTSTSQRRSTTFEARV